MVLSCAINIGAGVAFLVAHSFWQFALAAGLMGVYRALDSGPLEAWYVDAACRGRGIGRALIAAVEAWTREQGCMELASDALIDNAASHAAHAACGFEETERVVYFRKPLQA